MSFRDILQSELERRRARNRRYSLRAYASALQLDHATLSQILRGKRRLTTRAIRTLGARLKLTAFEIESHCAAANDDALLRFVQTPAFRADSRWIASNLGIQLDEVNVAIQRLIRMRRIELASPQKWEVVGGQSGRSVADRRA